MLTYEDIRTYALAKPAAVEDFPFDVRTAVFKVAGKMFLLCDPTGDPLRFNVKCEPERALMLRDVFDAVIPGYHMNKRHWNTVIVDGTIPDDDLRAFIDHSYDLVLAGLSRAVRREAGLEVEEGPVT